MGQIKEGQVKQGQVKSGGEDHGKPGNQIPRKYQGLTGNFDFKSRAFVAKMEYTNKTTKLSEKTVLSHKKNSSCVRKNTVGTHRINTHYKRRN